MSKNAAKSNAVSSDNCRQFVDSVIWELHPAHTKPALQKRFAFFKEDPIRSGASQRLFYKGLDVVTTSAIKGADPLPLSTLAVF